MRSLLPPSLLVKAMPRVLAVSALVLWQVPSTAYLYCERPRIIYECGGIPTCVVELDLPSGYLYCPGGYYCGDTDCHCIGQANCHS